MAIELPSFAEPARLTTNSSPFKGDLSLVVSRYPLVPTGRALKKKPETVTIYEYDDRPLDERSPVLFVHGLKGEYWPTFRFKKVIKKLASEHSFADKYKIYLIRYDTTAYLDTVLPQFKEAVNSLHNSTNKPITIVALSMGGNLAYESMLDNNIDPKIKLIMALGTPFHGSPLFSLDWMQYSMYEKLSFPWTRIDHSLAYRLYFARHRNLLSDFRWDNADEAIPDAGKFRSKLPLGPRGNLTLEQAVNSRLVKVNSQPANKKKVIAYGGYLVNRYMLPNAERYVESTIMYPYMVLTVKLPAHLAREHPVLKMLNHEIATVRTTAKSRMRAGTPFVYKLNDGITPIASALFLPNELCCAEGISKESDIAKLKERIDTGLARVFRNVDHLSFIDGYRPLRASKLIRDELHPEQKARPILDWLVSDLVEASGDSRLARDFTVR